MISKVRIQAFRVVSTVLVTGVLLVGMQATAQSADSAGVFQGKTFGEWSARWWQWAFSFPEGFPNGEPFQLGTVDCSAGQSGAVWFLAGTGVPSNVIPPGPGVALERTCQNMIPRGVALFFPLLNTAQYNPDTWFCPAETDYKCTVSEKRKITDAVFSDTDPGPFLKVEGVEVGTQACRLSAILDGQPVQTLDYPIVRTQSPLFTLEGDPETVSDGYWVMLPPLDRGDHTIVISGSLCQFNDYNAPVLFGIDVKYSLSVR